MRININNIPDYLKQNALWCLWRKDKIPFNPKTGGKAQSGNPNTFSDFDTAYGIYQKGGYAGLGISIFNGFGAIDIDNCIKNGVVNSFAIDIIDKAQSYTEISPSGKGIRIIFTLKNDFVYNKDLYYIHNHKKGLEIYIPYTTSRYVTITGNIISNNSVIDITPRLTEILDAYMLRNRFQKQAKETVVESITSEYPDGHYLKIGLEKDEKLKAYWNGARPLASESENDAGFMAKLLYWCNNDTREAIHAFISSPYAYQKDFYHKKKLSRPDYLPRLVEAMTPYRTAAEDNEEWKKNGNKW